MNSNHVSMSSGTRVLIVILSSLLVVSLAVAVFLVVRTSSQNQEIADLETALDTAAEQGESLQTQLEEAQAAAEAAADNEPLLALQTEYDSYREQTDATLSEQTQLMADLQAAYDDAVQTNATVQDAILAQEEAASTLADLQTEYEVYKSNSQAAYDALAAEYEQYKADTAPAPESTAAPAGESEADTQALQDLQAEYDAYKTNSEAALQAAQEEGAQALADLQAEYDAYIESAETKETEFNAALSGLQTEYDTYVESTEAKQTESDAALSGLQTEYDTYKNDAESRLTESALALSGLQTEFDNYKANAQTQQTDTAAALAASEAALAALKADSALAIENAAALQQASAADTQALTDLQTEFDTYKSTAEAAQEEAAQALITLQAELDTYKESAETKQTDAEASLAALQADLDTYKTETEAALAGSALALADLQTEFDNYKADTEAVLAARAAVNEAALQTAQDEAAQALSALQTEFDSYKASAETTQAETGDALQAAQQVMADDAKQIALLTIPADANGAGNSANGMLALFHNGNIFYHNNYNKGNIYVENTEGFGDAYQSKTDTNPIHETYNIMGLYQNYLYYNNNYRLYRVNLDTKKIDTIFKQFYMRPWSGIQVIGDTLYFLNSAYDGDGNYMNNLWQLDPKGKAPENVPGVLATAFTSDGQVLYYASIDKQALIRLDPASGEETTLLENAAASCLLLSGDTLYFSMDGQLMKIGTDGTALAAIGEAKGEYLNVIGDFVYYANTADGGSLYRIRADGLYNEKLCELENLRNINIAGGWVYFMQYETKNGHEVLAGTYKVRLDGSGLTEAKP